MNKELFETYLYNVDDLPPSSVAEIKQVIEEYPYFQTAHLLYLKSLHSNDSILYSKQLKRAACYVNDRSLLFKLIKGMHSAHRPGLLTAESPLPIKKQEAATLSSTGVAEDLKKEREGNDNEVGTEEKPKEKLNELILRRLKEIEEKNSADLELETELKSETFVSQTADGDADLLGFDYSIEESVREPVANKKTGKDSKFVPQSIEYIHSLEQKLSLAGKDYFEIDKENEEPKSSSQDKLIDAFLEKQPRIAPKRPEPSDLENEDISKSSVAEAEIMTETLAKIYMKQKQYEKAIKIYETLALKYPQKSIYFADQISQIKKLK